MPNKSRRAEHWVSGRRVDEGYSKLCQVLEVSFERRRQIFNRFEKREARRAAPGQAKRYSFVLEYSQFAVESMLGIIDLEPILEDQFCFLGGSAQFRTPAGVA
jgi:hypothetical protein